MDIRPRIPIYAGNFETAKALRKCMIEESVVDDKRGDSAYLMMGDHDSWYVVVYAGNLLGVVEDLRDGGYV